DPIDTSGVLLDGTPVNGPASLRQALEKKDDLFRRNFARNLLMYSLGRILQDYDMPTVRSIAREAALNNNRFSAFVMGIVKSTPFQMRRAEEVAPSKTDAAKQN